MLATTIQITNNPPHTTHTNNIKPLAGCVGNHHPQRGGGRSHGVEREPDSVLARMTFYAQPKTRTHTHHPPWVANSCGHKKTTNTTQQAMLLVPHKLGSLERR